MAQPSSVTACSPARSYVDVSQLRASQTRSPTRPITCPSRTTANCPTPFGSERRSRRSTDSSATARPPASPPIHCISSSSPTSSSRSSTSPRSGTRSTSRSVSSKRHQHRPLELDHDLVALVETARPHRDDSLAGPRARLALRENLRLGTDRVAREHRSRQRHVAPAEIDRLLREVDHRQSRDERERERRVDERPLPLRLRRVLGVEVNRVRVERQQREPDVVGLEYRPSEAAPVHGADLEIVVRPTHGLDHRIAARDRPREHPMNRLARETSPYLLQHADNPVDWYAWGDEAFARAREEDKPILLSVGYSACHWCHVMEHESFEDEATAKLMN